jgi:hypothetical protein
MDVASSSAPRFIPTMRHRLAAQPPGHQGQVGSGHQQVQAAGWRRTPDQAEQVRVARDVEALIGRPGWAH